MTETYRDGGEQRLTYVDSSAIVKLAVAEPESTALRRYLSRRQPLVSSALVRTGSVLQRIAGPPITRKGASPL
jgi:uncharacterized protein with PIN domain